MIYELFKHRLLHYFTTYAQFSHQLKACTIQ